MSQLPSINNTNVDNGFFLRWRFQNSVSFRFESKNMNPIFVGKISVIFYFILNKSMILFLEITKVVFFSKNKEKKYDHALFNR